MAAVIADSENGWAGQECLPWPNAVTRSGDGVADRHIPRQAGALRVRRRGNKNAVRH